MGKQGSQLKLGFEGTPMSGAQDGLQDHFICHLRNINACLSEDKVYYFLVKWNAEVRNWLSGKGKQSKKMPKFALSEKHTISPVANNLFRFLN